MGGRRLSVRRAAVRCPQCQRMHRSPTSDTCRPCRHQGLHIPTRICPVCHTHTLAPYQRQRCTACADVLEIAHIERTFAAAKKRFRATHSITDEGAMSWHSPLSSIVEEARREEAAV